MQQRHPPPQLLTRARTLAGYPDETVLLPLPVLALMIGVHVRTLHAAARSGRLGIAYDTRTTFRHLRPTRWMAMRANAGVAYVWSFAMFDSSEHLIRWLIFWTNHLRGLEVMKAAIRSGLRTSLQPN